MAETATRLFLGSSQGNAEVSKDDFELVVDALKGTVRKKHLSLRPQIEKLGYDKRETNIILENACKCLHDRKLARKLLGAAP